MSVIGYIRVSTIEQNSDLQRNALNSINCDHVLRIRLVVKPLSDPVLNKY